VYLWVKAFHVIFMVTWFAGLFYLPRLFVYHAMSEDPTSIDRFKVMERKLFWGIMTPGALVTAGLGLWLIALNPTLLQLGWMRAKLGLAVLLIAYHVWCGVLLRRLRDGRDTHSHVWYRWFNEVPVVFLLAIVILAVVEPI
jgi:putative membrane protein